MLDKHSKKCLRIQFQYYMKMWFKLVEILNCCKSCQLFLVEFKVLVHKGEKLEAGERPLVGLRLEIVEDSFIDVESKWLLD